MGLVIVTAALLLRWPDIGNPQLDLDEQMYLLVGDRMWQGLVPYVDIWDRKPIGLFLLYALARGAADDPYLGYQLLALVFAAATALVVARLVRLLDGSWAASLAGALVYLVWVALAGGRGGQSPVFYNLPMALAALATGHALRRLGGRAAGRSAMLLVGVAIQIKPTVVFEGCWFGLMLTAAQWRRERALAGVTREGALLVTAALVPTLLAFAGYAALGYGREWWFANVESIFLRGIVVSDPIGARLESLAIAFAVPMLSAAVGLGSIPHTARLAAGGWLAAALAGFFTIPPFYNHYALPVVLPMSVLAGIGATRRWPLGSALTGTAVALLVLAGVPAFGTTRAQRARLDAMTRTIERYRGSGCLYLFQAEPVFYVAARSCLPTRYPFSPHLTYGAEARAVGVDPAREVARIFASVPTVVVTIPPDPAKGPSFAVAARALARHYRRVGGDMGYVIYARRSVSRPAGGGSPPA